MRRIRARRHQLLRLSICIPFGRPLIRNLQLEKLGARISRASCCGKGHYCGKLKGSNLNLRQSLTHLSIVSMSHVTCRNLFEVACLVAAKHVPSICTIIVTPMGRWMCALGIFSMHNYLMHFITLPMRSCRFPYSKVVSTHNCFASRW